MNLELIKSNFENWNRKTPVTIGNSRQYKIIGCGKQAFKVLKLEPQQELNNKPGWSQVFWNYKDILQKCQAKSICERMEEMMNENKGSFQTTL